MKRTLGSILFLFSLSCFGQTNLSVLEVNDSSKQSTELNLSGSISLINASDIYVYNNGKDTISLSNLAKFGPWVDCKKYRIITSAQIDEQGAKVVVFSRKCSCIWEEHNATSDIVEKTKFQKYEVWDLDNKKMLFEGINHNRKRFDRSIVYHDPKREKGRSSYKYKFSMNSSGDIKLSQFRRKGAGYPDKQKGTYVFRDGNYIYLK